MRFTTTREKILNAVLIAERITGKKETLPVLSCVLLEIEKDLAVKATNLEAWIEAHAACDVSERGKVAVPAAILSQTLRSMTSDKLTLTLEHSNLVVESRGTRTLIKAIPHEEFPTLTDTTEEKGIEIAREKLLHGLHSVSYAASPSMIRPELGSIYVALKDGEMVAVATDSFRLAEKVMKGNFGKGSFEILIPLKHALELSHVLERIESDDVRVVGEDTQLTVSAPGLRFVSRVVEGTFPNYTEIMPKKFSTEATLLKNDMAEVLKKARVFSGNDQHVGFHSYPKKKVFTVTARSADVGEMSDSLDASLSGEDLDINFHIGYLADCLPIIQADSITLGFSGAGKPLVIHGVSDPSFTYLVMPLNR